MPRAEREELILEVAGQVFAREGYHSASMAEIAELAGVSKPMVYAYFGSKEELYVAYINRMGGELLDRLLRRVGQPRPADRTRLRIRVAEFLGLRRRASRRLDGPVHRDELEPPAGRGGGRPAPADR